MSALSEVRILDVCFGLGYNSFSAIAELVCRFPSLKITIIGIEIDRLILEKACEIFPSYSGVALEVAQAFGKKVMEGEDVIFVHVGNVSLRVYVADVLDGVIDGPFDIVFFDPFSPKVCPALWKARVFENIYEVMASSSVLATYSCARAVRDALKSVGFSVYDGPCVGRRAPSTIAVKHAPVV